MHKALRLFAVLLCLALAATSAQAQTRPTFEVASIRPAVPLDMAKVRNGEVRIGPRVDGARAEFLYVTLHPSSLPGAAKTVAAAVTRSANR